MEKIKSKFNIFIIIGITLILIGGLLILKNKYDIYRFKENEDNGIKIFFQKQINSSMEDENINLNETVEDNNNQEFDYIAVLEIPKMNLKKGLVDIDSFYNNVNYNIQILKESTIPSIDEGNLILAAHSGNSSVSFFYNLNILENNDSIYLYYNNLIFHYQVIKKYEVEKTGKIVLDEHKNDNYLTLISCKDGTNNQIVVIARIISVENYN